MATGDKLVNLDSLKAVYERIPSGSSLTDEIKEAMLQIASKVAYIDEHGQDYYNDLYNALYAITAIRLNTSSLTMNTIGGTSQLTATTTPAGGAVTWTSSNTAVATVSANGLVTAVAYGSATITATAGSVSATCSVVVAAATVTAISAVYTQSGTVYESASLDDLKADLVVTASWSDSTQSTVPSSDYTLSGTLSVGTSTITVSYGGKTTTFTVTVTAAPTLSSITAVYTQSGTVYDTDTLDSLKSDLVVTATYSDSSTAVVTAADYTLSGTLTEGTSTITVSYGGKTTTFTVTVTAESNVLYRLDNTAFDGSTYVDTQVALWSVDQDFSVVVDCTPDGNSQAEQTVFGTNKTTSPWNGMKLATHSGFYRASVIGNTAASTFAVSTIPTTATSRVKMAVTHEAESGKFTLYWLYENNLQSVTIAREFNPQDLSALVGADRSDASYVRYWYGYIHSLKIYGVCLSNAEINSILS